MACRESESIFDQLRFLEDLLPEIDATYLKLIQFFKRVIPILKKIQFNSDDQMILKDVLHDIHEELDEFSQLIRRGEGELDLVRSEMIRIKTASHPELNAEELLVAEAQMIVLEQGLHIREKALNHLNELIQLLDSMARVGEMTELDEKLLTEIVTDLKNLSENT